MKNFNLQSNFKLSSDQEKTVKKLHENSRKQNKQVLLGVTGSGKTFVMANLIKELEAPTLVLSHNKTLAAQLYDEFKSFFPGNAVKYFVSYYDYYQPEAYVPGKDLYIEKDADINKQIERFRLAAMNAAVSRRDVVIVASVSCIYNIGNPANYKNKAISLEVGQNIKPADLSRKLIFMQYERKGEDFEPGKFRIKGDVFDIWMPYEDFPVRIEFWGDDIESIAFIDYITGQKLKVLKQIMVYPGKPFVFEKERIKYAVEQITDDLDQRVNFLKNIGKNLEAERLKQRTLYDIEMLKEVGYCKGMENYSLYFEDRGRGAPPYTLLDYMPDDYLLMIDESHMTVPQVRGMYNGDQARKQTLVDFGFRLPTAVDNRPLNFEEFRQKQGGGSDAIKGNTIYVSATPSDWEIEDSQNTVVELLTRPTGLLDPKIEIRPTEGQIDNVIGECKKIIKKGQRVLITTLTKKMSEDLSRYLTEQNVKSYYLHSDIDTVERVDILRNLRLGKYDVLVGINLLREGIDLPEVSLVVILDADKEGFLRSETSLVQTMGRAARHEEGRVILYADRKTDSMKAAIGETERRREYQKEYNERHDITPTTIKKDIKKGLVEEADNFSTDNLEEQIDYKDWVDKAKPPREEVKKIIKNLEDKMYIFAENLNFEKAAEIRDKIEELKSILKS